MKKLIALILILLMCISLFAACLAATKNLQTPPSLQTPLHPADTSESAEEPGEGPR